MTKRKREYESFGFMQPNPKIKTCETILSYIKLKEQQRLMYGHFISSPISFTEKVQDTKDPICFDEAILYRLHSLWKVSCQMAYSIPVWNHDMTEESVQRLIDETYDFIVFMTKAASFIINSGTFEDWYMWIDFFSDYLMKTSLLFRVHFRHCMDIINFAGKLMFPMTDTDLLASIDLKAWPDAVKDRDIPPYFAPHFYGPFPDFTKLTTSEKYRLC
jgi:hypothetical protein